MKRKPMHPLGVLSLLFCALLSNGVNARFLMQKETSENGFLAEEIPLTIVSTTPEKLATGSKIPITGRESLTVVFSRPVLKLGQKIPDELPNEMKPFFLTPPVTGKFRWQTTYIVSFDPAEAWAADLEIEFSWNTELTTYDGVTLSVNENSLSVLTTPALELDMVSVYSNTTFYLTDNFWDAFVGTSYDFLPEVPSDAYLQITASSPVNLDALQNSLFLVDPLTSSNPPVSISITECNLPDIPCPDCFDQQEGKVAPAKEEENDPDYGATGGSLYYTTPVDTEETDSNTEVETEDKPKITLVGKSSSCINVSFTPENNNEGFLQGRRYSMILPAETVYSNSAGSLKDDIRIDFAGLRDFRFPFVEDKNFNISNPRLHIWLPHGLASDVNVSDLPIKLQRANNGQDVDFEIEQESKAILKVSANLSPGTTYRITAFDSTTVKDGYDLKLKRSTLTFLAAPIEMFFGAMKVTNEIPLAIFEDGEDWGSAIVAFSKGSALSDEGLCKNVGSVVDVWDVESPDDALSLLSPTPLEDPVADILGVAADRLVAERKDIAGEISELDISKLLGTSGIVASAYCRNDVYFPLIISQSKFQVVVLVSSAVLPKGRVALIWVTNHKDAKPVSGASVTLYTPKGNGYNAVAEGKTDSSGVGTLTVDPKTYDLTAIVTANGQSVYVPKVEVHDGILSSASDSIILDRPVARPGEVVNIKGYIMQNEAGMYLPVNAKNVRLVVAPSMVSQIKESDSYDIEKFNSEFGSYVFSLEIPISVISSRHTLRVVADIDGVEYIGQPEYLSVLDFRRPPALLMINAPEWFEPNKKAKVSASVATFAGAPIENAGLTFAWSIEDNARDADDEILAGRLAASTDSKGEASVTIDLSRFVNAPSAGTVLEIVVHYTGSSGERVEENVGIRLEPADVDIRLEKTLNTDIPLQEFGARAVVTEISGKPINSGTVDFELKESPAFRSNGRPTLKPTTSNKEAPGKSVAKCSKSVKSKDFCTFSLPKMGEYVLEACINVGKTRVCKRSYMGKTEEAWGTAPLKEHLPFGITPTSEGPYSIGDSATFLVENSFEDVTMLMAWGSRENLKTKLVSIKSGRADLKFDIDSACSANCALSLTAAIPRQTKSLASKIINPVDALFDPAMPHTEQYTTVVTTKQKKSPLSVQVSLPNIKKSKGIYLVEPGVNASVRVIFDTKTPVEITAFAIDTRILDLLPYPLKDVQDDFIADLSDYFMYKSTSEYLVSPGAIDAVSKANEARKKLDPWFKLISTLSPSDEAVDINLDDEEYLEKYVQWLTVIPRTEEEQNLATAAKTSDTEETETKETTSNDIEIAIEHPEYEVPTLFESYTASGGVWLVNFEGPVKGGVFAIRAYASTGKGHFGSDEVLVKVSKSLSMTYDFPVFARLGDEFDAGITLSVLERASKPIVLSIDISENLKLSGPDIRNVGLGKDLEKEERFIFTATGVGESVIEITADDGFGHEAKVTIRMTIYGIRPAVVLGTAFPVSGANSKESKLEIEIPEALEGSGSIVATAGKGFFPGIILLADLIYSQDSFACPISADFVVAAIAIPAIVDKYYPWSPDPNLLPEYYVDLINNMIPNYGRAISTIYSQSTSEVLGLEPEVPCETTGIVRSTGVSLEQNAKGIFVITQVEKKLKEHNLEEIYKNTAAVTTSLKIWISVLETGLVDAAIAAREEKQPISISTLAIVRLALGAKWSPPKGTPSQVVSDISMDRLRKEFNSMSIESQAYYILTLLGANTGKTEVSNAIRLWSGKIASSGSRSYLATSPKGVTPESSMANSLVFLAMVRAKADGNILKRLAYYVMAPISDEYGFTEYTIFGKMTAMLGLAEFDATVKTNPKTDLRLEMRSGTITLLQESFTPGRTEITAESTSWNQLGKSPNPIEVFPQGSGDVTVGIALKYIPRDPLDSSIYKGIFVNRVIQLDTAGPISEEVTQVPLGTVVDIKAQFLTPNDLDHTTVEVLLPAGVQPVQLGGEGDEYCPIPFFDLYGKEFYPSCPEQITLADKVLFVYESISAGAHTVSFKAVAAISGSFGVPPTRVYVTDMPSITGISSASRLDICATADKKCNVKTTETDFIATECKSDCNENGACDLGIGKCVCFFGFDGDDCQKDGAVA